MTFFSDLVNFECAVKVHEQYISWNMLHVFCLGTLCVGNFIVRGVIKIGSGKLILFHFFIF
jgi:hypothetical protein